MCIATTEWSISVIDIISRWFIAVLTIAFMWNLIKNATGKLIKGGICAMSAQLHQHFAIRIASDGNGAFHAHKIDYYSRFLSARQLHFLSKYLSLQSSRSSCVNFSRPPYSYRESREYRKYKCVMYILLIIVEMYWCYNYERFCLFFIEFLSIVKSARYLFT